MNQLLEFLSNKSKKTIKLNLTPMSKDSLLKSKIGGYPYWAKNEAHLYPKSKFDGKPLRLLAQINLDSFFYNLKKDDEELGNELTLFPQKGILQFFIPSCESNGSYFGLVFNHPTITNDIAVVYHDKIVLDTLDDAQLKEIHSTFDEMPFDKEYLLSGVLTEEFCSPIDKYNFSKITNGKNFNDDDIEALYEFDDEKFNNSGTKMAGFSYFTQSDPREYGDKNDDWIMLLQIDSEEGIMWADSGVANFFIKKEDLKKKNFSNILYNWDCC